MGQPPEAGFWGAAAVPPAGEGGLARREAGPGRRLETGLPRGRPRRFKWPLNCWIGCKQHLQQWPVMSLWEGERGAGGGASGD